MAIKGLSYSTKKKKNNFKNTKQERSKTRKSKRKGKGKCFLFQRFKHALKKNSLDQMTIFVAIWKPPS